jgi:RHS repeat-associated protein
MGFQRMLFVVVLVCVACGEMRAQDVNPIPVRGFLPGHDQLSGSIDNIDIASGKLNVTIPLGSLPRGKGGTGYSLNLQYESRLYDLQEDILRIEQSGFIPPQPFLYPYATLVGGFGGGWNYTESHSYSILAFPKKIPLDPAVVQQDYMCQDFKATLYQYRVFLPGGSSHVLFLRDDAMGGLDGYYGHEDYCARTYLGWPSAPSNPVWFTNDGSYLKYENDRLYFPDGRIVSMDADATREYDANGNYVVHKVSGGGATVTISHDEDPVAGRKIEIQTVQVSQDGNWVRHEAVVPGPNGDATYAIDLQKIQLNGIEYSNSYEVPPEGISIPENILHPTLDYSLMMIRYIQLPLKAHTALGTAPSVENSYAFTYELDYGMLTSIRTPTGSTYTYDYADDKPWCAGAHEAYRIANCQYVSTKTVTYDDAKTLSWEFTPQLTGSPAHRMVTIANPDNGKLVYHYGSYNSGSWDDYLVTKIEEYDHDEIKRRETVRSWSGTSENSMASSWTQNSWMEKEIVSVFNPAGGGVKSAITTYSRDWNGNLLEKKEYDWVTYGTAIGSTVKRRTAYDYYVPVTLANRYDAPHNTGLWPAGTARRLNAVKRVTVYEGASTPKAATEYTYDNVYSKGNVTYERRWDSKKASALPSLGGLTLGNSQEFRFGYDAYGNLVDKWEPSVGDAGSPRAHITYTEGNSLVEYVYTGYGTPAQGTVKYDWYNKGAALWTKTDVENNLAAVYEYDNLGRQTLAVSFSGSTILRETSTTYDDENRNIEVASDLIVPGDGKLQTWTHYDMLGRVKLAQQSDGAPLTAYWPPLTDESEEDSGIKVMTDEVYPASGGRLTITTTPYRSLGDATLEWTCTKYDGVGRVTLVSRFKGDAAPTDCGSTTNRTGLTQTAYDAEWTTVTDPAGKVRKQKVDVLGRLVEVVEDPGASPKLNYSTTYSYDALDNLTQVVQGQGVQTRGFTYSSLSRLISATNPESGVTQYEYYDSGDLKKKTDARGKWVGMTYDPLHRILAKTFSDTTPAVTYTYHLADSSGAPNIGRLESISSSVASVSYVYNSLGSVAASTHTVNGLASTQFFSYDWYLNGKLKNKVYPSGRQVNYNVDDAGRTNKVYAGTVNYADMTAVGINDAFYADGRIRQLKLGNGRYETHDYHTPGTPTVYKLGIAVGDGSLSQIEYDFHPATNNGNVWKQRIIRPQFSVGQEYGYDALNRISSMYESADVNRTYGYDRYGNRYVATSSSQIPPPIAPEPTLPGHYNAANNRLVMSGTGFDAAGNQTTLAPYTLEYDAEGRNTVVKLSGASYATFSYDGEGRRVKKAMNGGDTTYYLYDALGQMAVEYSTETPSSTGPSYLFTDMLGSVRTITNNVGAVVECYDYLPFGRMLGDDVGGRGTCYPDPPDVNYDSRAPQKFTGKERDAETGLDYFGARYYSGAEGRFTSPDPGAYKLEDPRTFNRYAYVNNNPLKYIDPTGREANYVLDLKNKTITFYVSIALWGPDADEEYAKKLKKAAESAWQGKYKDKKSGVEFAVATKADVSLYPSAEGRRAPNAFYVDNTLPTGSNFDLVGNFSKMAGRFPGDPGPHAGNLNPDLGHERHEIGHVLGLPQDDYHLEGTGSQVRRVPNDGFENHLMGNPNALQAHQEEINQLGSYVTGQYEATHKRTGTIIRLPEPPRK